MTNPPPLLDSRAGAAARAPASFAVHAILLLAAFAAFVVTVRAILPLLPAAKMFAVLAWFAVPGVVLAKSMYGRQPGWRAAALLAGPSWGYVLSSLSLLAFWTAGVRSFPWLMLAPVPAALIAWTVHRVAPALWIPRLTRRDIGACALVLLAVPAVVGLPFAHIGEDLPEGRAYRAYFTADFVWQMAVASEVSKGDTPPQNPYFVNDPLYYYWLMHLVPSVLHRETADTLRVEQPLLVNGLWSALGFAGFLYFFVRHFVERPWAAALGCVGVIFCSSFEGVERLWTYTYEGETLATAVDATRYLNIDAITGWMYGSLRIDGLHRLLLYQPQHQVGYLLGFSALLLLVQARERVTTGVLFLAGGFLALSLLVSPFGAGIFAVMVGLFAAVRLVRARQWATFVTGAVAAAVPLGLAFLLTQLLHYADPQAQVIAFGVNPLATRNWATAIFLSFGPVLVVALGGVAAAAARGALDRFVPILIALAICFIFYFLVDVPDVQGVYVGFHVGKIAFAAFVPLCAYALQELWRLRLLPRMILSLGTLAVALIALPTVLIDLYNTQDIWNREEAPFGGSWTLVLSPEEVAGLDWIKRFTPAAARVQVEPIARQRGAWAYIPAFGERRMSAGMPTSMVPLSKYEEASGKVRTLYESATAREAHERAIAQCIDYLVIGDPERAAYPQFQPVVDSDVDLFRPAFRNGVLDVYSVQRDSQQAPCAR